MKAASSICDTSMHIERNMYDVITDLLLFNDFLILEDIILESIYKIDFVD